MDSSLNLHTLANSLPTAQQNAEKDLANNFKAAALSITTLYRSSRKNSKRAYNAGYAAACQDLLTMIQQGVSLHPGTPNNDSEEGGGMTIGRVMDWTEARLEAIKAREEEEDEEEEREKEKEERSRPTAAPQAAAPVPLHKPDNTKQHVRPPSARLKDQNVPPPIAHSPRSQPHAHLPPSEPPSSPAPPPPTLTATTLRPSQRHRSRPVTATKGEPPTSYTHTYTNSPATAAVSGGGGGLDSINNTNTPLSTSIPTPAPFSDIPIQVTAGAKRRHAMMMMLDSSAPPASVPIGSSSGPASSPIMTANNTTAVTGGGGNGFAFGGSAVGGGGGGGGGGTHASFGSHIGSRRRTRSTKSLGLGHHASLGRDRDQNLSLMQAPSEAMDIEEDGGGRERKRVARR